MYVGHSAVTKLSNSPKVTVVQMDYKLYFVLSTNNKQQFGIYSELDF